MNKIQKNILIYTVKIVLGNNVTFCSYKGLIYALTVDLCSQRTT